MKTAQQLVNDYAAAERGTLVFCGAFDTRDQFPAYRDMCDRIGAIKDKYRAPVA